MGDAKALVRAALHELDGLIVQEVVERGGGLAVVTAGGPVGRPVFRMLSERLHAWHERSAADLPVAGVRVELRARSSAWAARPGTARTRHSASRSPGA